MPRVTREVLRSRVAGGFARASIPTPIRTRRSRATCLRGAGTRLRAGLTGREDNHAVFPGFHPGLAEPALQAEVAGVDIQISTHL
jgi:hypothetical protein